jgi:hypothetical protein
VQGLGFTSGVGSETTTLAYADSVVSNLLKWNVSGATGNAINAVRVPLNEDCWLGINGAPAAYSGVNYQAFIQREVSDLTAAGMYSILDLHWTAPGSYEATGQNVAPDADHSVTFWQQAATTFKGNSAVMFDLYNEPRLWCYTTACSSNYTTAEQTAWGCYLNGCSYTTSGNDSISGMEPAGTTFTIAGTQQLVNTIRAAGASNVIVVEGLGYANSTDGFMPYAQPSDSLHNVAFEVHVYPSSGANSPSAMTSRVTTNNLSSSYPIFMGEFGEPICSGTSSGFTANMMNWADTNGYSYTAWGWDAGEGCGGPSLVTNDDTGTTTTYGAIVEAHLQSKEP